MVHEAFENKYKANHCFGKKSDSKNLLNKFHFFIIQVMLGLLTMTVPHINYVHLRWNQWLVILSFLPFKRQIIKFSPFILS